MKKRILLALVLATLAFLLLSVGALAADSGAGEADSHVWEITSADGTVTYADDFFTPITNAAAGDTLRLIPDYIELDRIFTVSHSNPFTLDLGDSTIVYPNPNITAPVLNISQNCDVTFRANGAKICLQIGVRSFASVQGKLTVLGEGEGLTVLAPDAFDAGGNAIVDLYNVTMVKHCSNMMGLLCARANSRVSAYNCRLISSQGWTAAYSTSTGILSLYDCEVISTDLKNAVLVDTATASLYAEGTVFSCGFNQKGIFTVGPGCYLPITSGYSLAPGVSELNIDATASLVGLDFVAPDSYTAVSATPCPILRYTVEIGEPTDTPTDSSAWRVTTTDGGEYFAPLYYPFFIDGSVSDISLLTDCSIPFAFGASLKCDLLNLGEHTFTATAPAWLTVRGTGAIFNVGGDTPFTFTSSGKIASDHPLLATTRPTVLNLDGATVSAPNLVTSTAADVTVNGGEIHTTADALIAYGAADLHLNNTLILSDGIAVSSGRSVYVTDSLVASGVTSFDVMSDVSLAGNTLVSGSITATAVRAENGVLFDTPPTEQGGLLCKTLDTPVTDPRLASVRFAYCADTPDHLSLSISMSNYVTLNVLVPAHVYNFDALTVISVDGIVYAPDVTDGTPLSIDGTDYVKFTFRHIYPTDILGELSVRIITSGTELSVSTTVSDLMLASFDVSDDDSFKRAVATYLDLAYSALGVVVDMTALAPYVSRADVPVPTAPDFVSSVFFDAERCRIILRPSDGTELKKLSLTWEDEDVIVRASDGIIEMPFLRLDPSCTIVVFYTAGDETRTEEIGILSLYATVADSPGRSTALLEKYLRYLILISES